MQFPLFLLPYVSESTRFIMVEVADPNHPHGMIHGFERADTNNDWIKAFEAFEVVIGKNGLANGPGLFHFHDANLPLKKEGDLRTPTGLFELGIAFGYEAYFSSKSKWPYLALTDSFLGIDDPESRYYNCIIDSDFISKPDWKSAETMVRNDGLYKYGMVLNYNLYDPIPGLGSQIFMHIWRAPDIGTEGCLAMPEIKLKEILDWITDSDNQTFIFIASNAGL